MPDNNLQSPTETREASATAPELRDHRVILGLTESEFEELKALVPVFEERLGRKVVPLGTAAYEVFRRGLELERAA